MQVKDIMVRDVKSADIDANLETVALMMWHNNCGSIPVMDHGGKPVGIITDRDIAMAAALNHRALWDLQAKEIMSTKNFQTCYIDDDIRQAMKTIWAQRVRRLPVVDHQGDLQGILSIDDILARAERGTRGQVVPPELSYDDAMSTVKAVVAHH